MDLVAYAALGDPGVTDYIKKHYGDVPRMRGVRFMKVQKPEWYDEPTFKRLCGKDIVYIHTRCGPCGRSFDNDDTNYTFYGADKWEKGNKLFLTHAKDKFDGTYCDHYFLAVVDDEYNAIIEMYRKQIEETENKQGLSSDNN